MRILLAMLSSLLQDFRNHTRADRPSTLADGKPQLLFHRDRRDQLDRHLRVVARHHHLHPRRQLHTPRHVRRPEVELRPVPLEERRMPPALFLRRSEEHTSELQSLAYLVCRLLLEKKKKIERLI